MPLEPTTPPLDYVDDIQKAIEAYKKGLMTEEELRAALVAVNRPSPVTKFAPGSPMLQKRGGVVKKAGGSVEQKASGGQVAPGRADRAPRKAYGGGFSKACDLKGPNKGSRYGGME